VYFPACVLLGRWSDLWVSVWVAYVSPLLGVVLITLAWRVWRVQLNHYTSAGG
jgi:ABC-2 type transport system permease protein